MIICCCAEKSSGLFSSSESGHKGANPFSRTESNRGSSHPASKVMQISVIVGGLILVAPAAPPMNNPRTGELAGCTAPRVNP